MTKSKQNLLNFTLHELEEIVTANDLKPFLAKQIFEWIYKKRVSSFEEMTNVSKVNIEFLKTNFYFCELKLKLKQIDKFDETTK